jgi:DNA-binding winged helix-turn-helix (wHTH) protein
MGNETEQLYEFGPYRLDPGRKLLLRNGELVALTSKALEILLVLVERSEHVVTKDELMKEVWPNSFVEEANLTQHISMVRKALGETPQDHRYIVTFPGQGYRFRRRSAYRLSERDRSSGGKPFLIAGGDRATRRVSGAINS